ncbi:glutathione S-transferase [Anabrus simplex]|uniref:glutathione S-transferase n=1 Tax=Anabrus simplex TaxID=316456 RepID=UPI0035A39F0F
MAPKYKLTYFEGRGLAEPIRYILCYGGVQFEDNRIQQADWPKIKPSTPFGKLPMLEEDGKVYDQSSAICRYLARTFNLVGSNEQEALRIDAVVDTITDLRLEMYKYAFEEAEAVKAKNKEDLEKEKLPFYLSKLDDMVKENGGYFVGGKLSWADLLFAGFHDFFSFMWDKKSLTENYPHLKALLQKVNNLPQISAWIKKRPVSEW